MQQRLAARVFYGWVIVYAALAINAVSATLNTVVFSFMIGPMSADLGVARSALSLAITLRLLAGGFSGPLVGRLIDRHGARWLGAGIGILVGTTLILLGTAQSLWFVYLMFALSGLSGLGSPSGQLVTQVPIAKWFVARRGRALSIATMGLAGGTVIAVPITQWLVETVGWRGTTVTYGIVVLAVVPTVSLLFVRRAPEDHGLHPDGALRPPEPPPTGGSDREQLATSEDWTLHEALRTPVMWQLLAALALAGVALTGTLVHRIDFWENLGMSPALVGFGTMLDPMMVVISIFVFGWVADRVPVRQLGFLGLLGFGTATVPMILSNGEPLTIVLHNLMWGASAGGYITLNNLVWPNYFGREFLGTIRGVVLPVAITATGAGAPLFGLLFESALGPREVWLIGAGMFTGAALLVLTSRPPRRPVRALAPDSLASDSRAPDSLGAGAR